jgi:hypothetical protein
MKSTLRNMIWLYEPEWGYQGDTLWVKTFKDTDYWQRTHYGFQRDNAHALVQEVAGDFTLRARLRFAPTAQYDQCGLLLRIDENNWFKCSVEYETPHESRLGSVLTTHGYSDWATQDIPSDVREIWYTIEFTDSDLLASYSLDGAHFHQMRLAHLDAQLKPVLAGIYGCSPTGDGFRFELLEFSLDRKAR